MPTNPLEANGTDVFSEAWIEELVSLEPIDPITDPRRHAAQVLFEAGIDSPHLRWDDFDDFTMAADNVAARKAAHKLITAEDRKWTEADRLAFLENWFTDDNEEEN
jgi:hypothetical protein